MERKVTAQQPARLCSTCHGTGKVREEVADQNGKKSILVSTCPNCNGRRQVGGYMTK